jgi:hypothetical protein
MRQITNTTMQLIFIPFVTKNGLIEMGLRPKKTVIIPDDYSSVILNNLIKRRQIKIKEIN